MQEGLRSEIRRLTLLVIVFIGIGLVNGYPLETLVIGAALYTFYTFGRIRKVYHWLYTEREGMPPEMGGLWGDLTDELYRRQQRLEQAKKNYTALALRIRQITSALDDGMILLTADRTLDWWNPSATQLLNLKEDDRGEVISNLIRNPTFVNYIHGEQFDRALEVRSVQDENRIYQFTAGQFGRGEVVLMVRDITRLRQLEEMRKEFVANISHELRTPLTVLVGYIETLQMNADSVPRHWQKALLQMDQQTKRLSSLAEDLVMLSRLESTPPAAGSDRVDICKLLEGIVESARIVAGDHHLSLACEPDLTLPGATKELNSAFSNLVFNAVKHNPQGCDIHVRAATTADGLVVEVSDTGTGIDEKHLPRLTERFYRVDDSRTTASGGTGLGLAIVKHVLNRHRGTLEVASTLGKGTTFRCRFKLPPQQGEG